MTTMTAVTLQQSAHPPALDQRRSPAQPPKPAISYQNQSRYRSLVSSDYTHENEATGTANRSSTRMAQRTMTNGFSTASGPDAFAYHSGRPSASQMRSANHDSHPSPTIRPSSAPGNRPNLAATFADTGTSDDDGSGGESGPSAQRTSQRRSKPPLLRSRSEHAGLRGSDEADLVDDEPHEWGARHGFEDHYQSEDIISQLANVCGALYLLVSLRYVPSLGSSARSLLDVLNRTHRPYGEKADVMN